MKELEKEKLKLEKIIEKYKDVINDLEFQIEFLPNKYKDNPNLLNTFLKLYSKKIERMKSSRLNPYFARIDFKDNEDNKTKECYIGKVGVFDENEEPIVIDWRAPIASVYYDSNIGSASYNSPGGIRHGELLLKRQYDIENGKLLNFRDVDTVTSDEILEPYLNANADSRLKNIVASIQTEQNEIIRDKLVKNLVVQGVAGSGKTTVALHRVAYLVYNYMDKIKPEQYIILGPNKFFVNYISGVLPDLDVNNVAQLTYVELVNDLLEKNLQLISDEPKLIKTITGQNNMFFEKIRVSNSFRLSLDKYLEDYDKEIVPNKDLIIKGYSVIPESTISKIYNSIDNNSLSYKIIGKKIERAILLIGKYIVNNKEKILIKLREEYLNKVANMSRQDIQKERKKLIEIEKEIKNNCNQTLRKHFSKNNIDILKLYIKFLNNIEKYVEIKGYNIKDKSKKIIENIKKEKVEFEDLSALVYLYYRINGTKNHENYRHVVIDEAQDYGEFNFSVLKDLMPKATFSIFGDLAQSIYQYRNIDDWTQIVEGVFQNNCDMKYLNKSYRTTFEIMNSANNIIHHIGLKPGKPVIRHGERVMYSEIKDNQIELIIDFILKSQSKGYDSIAVISKTEEESKEINKMLNNKGIDAKNISSKNTNYEGKICTIPCYLAKGLEFDSVIIADASNEKYNGDKIIDMKLLYVSMTRALHELKLLYFKNISEPLKKEIKK